MLFFSLDRKEPKDLSGGQTGQDCQKKSGNSTAHLTKILKLPRTQHKINFKDFMHMLSAGSDPSVAGQAERIFTLGAPEFTLIFSECL